MVLPSQDTCSNGSAAGAQGNVAVFWLSGRTASNGRCNRKSDAGGVAAART